MAHQLTDELFLKVAEDVDPSQITALGLKLQLKATRIKQIQHDHPRNVRQAIVDMLVEWRTYSTPGGAATREVLVKALREADCNVAGDILENVSVGHCVGSAADDSNHIMISYQWDAQPRMLKLRDQLISAGYEVWMDVDKMDGNMDDRMAEAVEQASIVLICFSKNYQESANCKKEAQYASKRKKQIVPLKYEDYDPTGWLGLMISALLYYDVQTDAAMMRNLPNIIRAFDKRGVSRKAESEIVSSKSSSEVSQCAAGQQVMGGSGFSIIKSEDVVMGDILGGGGFGTVYLAGHTHWGDVAIKQFKTIESEVGRRREAEKMLRAIHSPYLVRIMGIIDDPQNLSIVMEYFKHGNLKDFRRSFMHSDTCLPRKIRMIQEISLGMNYLHTLTPPIIHRDLKLSNVFVGNGFEAKIGDLGLAINKKSTSSQGSYDVTAGTCTHLPPEAWAKTQTEPKEPFDIYTFGITLHEFLSGQDPWPENATPSLISQWVQGGQRPWGPGRTSIPDTIPPEIVSIMKECCSVLPKDRPSFQEIQKRVSGLYTLQFKDSINTADQTIMSEKIKVDQASSNKSAPSSTHGDSGTGSQPPRAELNRARPIGGGIGHDTLAAAPLTDSGIGISGASSQEHAPQVINLLRKIRQFGKPGKGPADFGRARGIAISPSSGDVAVADPADDKRSVLVFSQEGQYKYTVKSSPDADPEGQLRNPHDVAITADDCLMIVDQTKFVKIFDAADGTYLKSFSTMDKYDAVKKVGTSCVAVDVQGQIIVGNYHRKLVTIHEAIDGSTLEKFTVDIAPYFIATNTREQIVIGDLKSRKVVVVDYHGKEVFSINPLLEGSPCIPMGVACNANDDIFVAVVKQDDSGKGTFDTGCILQYNSSTGLFLACVARDLCYPMGIGFSQDGALLIANHDSVVAFATE